MTTTFEIQERKIVDHLFWRSSLKNNVVLLMKFRVEVEIDKVERSAIRIHSALLLETIMVLDQLRSVTMGFWNWTRTE